MKSGGGDTRLTQLSPERTMGLARPLMSEVLLRPITLRLIQDQFDNPTL